MPDTETKILHVLSSPRAEGTVRLALDWLATPGVVQDVFVLQANPPEMTASLQGKARWISVNQSLPPGLLKFPWLIWKTWAVSRRCRPTMVVCWPNGFSSWILAGAWLAGVRRLVCHAGNPPTRTFFGTAHTVLTTRVISVLRGEMVCCSDYVAREFARIPGGKAGVLRVVSNCAPVSEIQRASSLARQQRIDRRPRLIMVGTLEAHKDHETLLRAMVTVAEKVPDIQLWLAGDGTRRSRLQSLASSLGISRSVTFLGSRRNVAMLLGQCDLFVFSTTPDEGFGTVLIEAMAAGLPIVASDVAACREALAGGRWGALVPPADPAALAASILASLGRSPAAEDEDRSRHLRLFEPRSMMESYLNPLVRADA